MPPVDPSVAATGHLQFVLDAVLLEHAGQGLGPGQGEVLVAHRDFEQLHRLVHVCRVLEEDLVLLLECLRVAAEQAGAPDRHVTEVVGCVVSTRVVCPPPIDSPASARLSGPVFTRKCRSTCGTTSLSNSFVKRSCNAATSFGSSFVPGATTGRGRLPLGI